MKNREETMSLIRKMGVLVAFATGVVFTAQVTIAGESGTTNPLVVLFPTTLNLSLLTRGLFLVPCMGRTL